MRLLEKEAMQLSEHTWLHRARKTPKTSDVVAIFCRGAELGSLPPIAKVMTVAGAIPASRSEPVAESDEDVAIRRPVRDAKECLIATNAG